MFYKENRECEKDREKLNSFDGSEYSMTRRWLLHSVVQELVQTVKRNAFKTCSTKKTGNLRKIGKTLNSFDGSEHKCMLARYSCAVLDSRMTTEVRDPFPKVGSPKVGSQKQRIRDGVVKYKFETFWPFSRIFVRTIKYVFKIYKTPSAL